jgi:transcriptional regulator GlxA family with amidase domain
MMYGIQNQPSPSRRAADVLADRLYEPWSVDRLASTLGLSSRTLHRVVRRELGVSPMLLLRRVRLAQARADLERPARETSVTSVAYDCGFNHLGRFSQQYARQFGESPSETLRRARRLQVGSAWMIPEAAGSAA